MRFDQVLWAFGLVSGLWGATACSSDSTSSPGAGTADAAASANDSDAEADASGTSTKSLVGPTITSVMKMTGSLHVSWDLPAKCDNVELERKDGTAGAFKVAYKLPGTVDNKHDGTATGDMVYTYRSRCKVGAEYTEYSNEMGKNPQ